MADPPPIEPTMPPVIASERSLGGSIRRALKDAYHHSWRLLPANVVWSVALIGITRALVATPLALVLVPLLALPTAGIFRITTRIVRGEVVSFRDAVDAWRTGVRATLLIGAAVAVTTLAFFTNIVTGLSSASPIGWALATLAGWCLIAEWLLVWALWPILLDPVRQDRPLSERIRLAALLILAHPFRISALALVLAVFLAASALSIVALAIISIALAALLASHDVLPAADRLEDDLARRRTRRRAAAEGSTPASSEH